MSSEEWGDWREGADRPAPERVGGKLIYDGPIASLRMEVFRRADGSTYERQVLVHPGAVAIVAHDSETLYMVRQAREPVGEGALLELPAGKLDVEGETPLEAAKRELAEEIGKRAEDWHEVKRFYASPGISGEEYCLYLANELSDSPEDRDAEEGIEVVEVPLSDLDDAIEETRDAKSLVGLLWLREELGA